ncbi:MAG: hypothetical protein HY301_00650 [Verrucomicrobia bacterium]|nr:hypothetical protein [Verrucomicrobiota bacterium]
MKPLIAFLMTTGLLTTAALGDTENFDTSQPGALPSGWAGGSTGGGAPRWAVVKDATAPSQPNALKQSGAGRYPWCVKKDASLTDGFVEVKFKALSGEEDRAGGLVWRWQDGDNYYVARANALEDNVCIYHTIKGRRTETKRAEVKVTPNEWHTLRVDFQASQFKVSFDGKAALEWDDETFKQAGAVGVWTKADSVTLFDDFSYGGK